MANLFYEYAKCSTCRKARAWLEKNKIPFKAIPLVEQPPSKAELKDYWKRSGLELRKLFNTSGELYRSMELSSKLVIMNDDEKLELLSKNGKLIKRPLLVTAAKVLVGFDEAAYKTL